MNEIEVISSDDQRPSDRVQRSNASKARLDQTKNQVNEVMGVMKTNMTKLMERDGALSDLEMRASELNLSSEQFQLNAKKIKRKFWWQNLKVCCITQ